MKPPSNDRASDFFSFIYASTASLNINDNGFAFKLPNNAELYCKKIYFFFVNPFYNDNAVPCFDTDLFADFRYRLCNESAHGKT